MYFCVLLPWGKVPIWWNARGHGDFAWAASHFTDEIIFYGIFFLGSGISLTQHHRECRSIMNIPGIGHQLFALRIDEKLRELVVEHTKKGLGLLSEQLRDNYAPELEFVCSLSYYLATALLFDRCTPGMLALNIGLRSVQRRRLICSLFLVYLFRKVKLLAMRQRWSQFPMHTSQRKAWRALLIIEFIVKLTKSANFLAFLLSGKFPSLLYRAASLETKISRGNEWGNSRGSALRDVPSNALFFVRQRQLMWEVVSVFLGSLATSLDWKGLALSARLTMIDLSYELRTWLGWKPSAVVVPSELTNRCACSACSRISAECPHVASCGHIFCYFCLRSAIDTAEEHGTHYRCPMCGAKCRSCTRKVLR